MGWRDPKETSEFEIHSELYQFLKKHYPNVRGELHYKWQGKQAAKFDIAILNEDDSIDVVVEVKRANKRMWEKKRTRYEYITDRPCVVIAGMNSISTAIEKIEQAKAAWKQPI